MDDIDEEHAGPHAQVVELACYKYRITHVDSSLKHGEVDASKALALIPLTANYRGNDHDFVHSPGVISSAKKAVANSRAIVPVTPVDSSRGDSSNK